MTVPNIFQSLVLCGVYHWLWISVIPNWRGYKIRQEIIDVGNGAQTQTLIKVPVTELSEWDFTHDHAGNKLTHRVNVSQHEKGTNTGSGEETDSNKEIK